jgi:hypothetical protein
MAQEVDLFKSGAVPATAFAAVKSDQPESLADGIGQGYGVIGYKGKNWTLRYDGVVYPFVRADDGSPMNYIDAIILRAAPHKSKSFYPSKEEGGGYSPEASEGKRPTCASLDSIKPDDDVLVKQNDNCMLCKRNEWKTMPNGKKGQECTDYKRLAICILPSLAQRIVGRPFQEPVFLRIPPASLTPLANFGREAEAKGFPYYSFVTRISFDPDEPHPKFMFKSVNPPITNKEAPFIIGLREGAIARRITGEDTHVAAVARLASQPQQELAKPTAVKQPAPQAIELEPEATETGFGEPGPAAVEIQTSAIMVGGQTGTSQTVEDVGETTESDEALDVQIQEILAKKKQLK